MGCRQAFGGVLRCSRGDEGVTCHQWGPSLTTGLEQCPVGEGQSARGSEASTPESSVTSDYHQGPSATPYALLVSGVPLGGAGVAGEGWGWIVVIV